MPAAERFRAIVETAVDAVISIDADGRIETFNPSAERLFGYRAEEVMGLNVRVLMDARTGRDHDGHIRRVLDGGEPRIIGVGREVTGRHRDGSPIALHLSVGKMDVEGRPGFVGIMRDIRPEVALREALRARDGEYASVTEAMTDGLVVQRADGGIVTSNAAAHRILGLSADQLSGRTNMDPRWRAIREDGSGLPGREHPTAVTLRTGERIDGAVMGVEHPSGARLWLEVSSFPVDLAGEVRPGVAAVFRDVTEARLAARRLAESERSFRLLAENSTDVVIRTLWDSTVAYVSPQVTRLLGYEPSALQGRLLTQYLHPDDALRHPEIREHIDAAEGVAARELRLRHADGTWLWCEATVRAVRGPDGQVVERQSAIRSIARRKAAQSALAESLGRHKALIGHLPGTAVVMFDHDLHVAVAEGPSITTLLGEEDAVGRPLVDIAPPESRDQIIQACIRTLGGGTRTWRMDKRGRTLDATLTPVEANGAIIGGMVVAVDVTERAALEAEQEALHDIANAVARDAAPEEVLSLVADRVSLLFGAVGAAVFRCEAGGAVAVATAPATGTVIRLGDRFDLSGSSALAEVLRHGNARAVSEYTPMSDPLVVALRSMGAVGGAAAPITVRGELWGVVGFGGSDPLRLDESTAQRLGRFADLVATTIANADEWQRLRLQASTDPLTGLANRAAFDQRFAEELTRVQRGGLGLAVVVLDADHFKRVNDRHGHAVGDRVLASLAATLRGAARGGDMVARIGGEEFAWLMPGVDLGHAIAAADRVRQAMEGTRDRDAGVVTISAGVATSQPEDDQASLLARADTALYAAKHAGRNRVVPWSPGVAITVAPVSEDTG